MTKLFANILGVSMQGEKVVKLLESSDPEFPHMDGRIIEFRRESRQVEVFEIVYGLKITGAGRGPELARAYLKGLDGAV